MSSPGVHAMCRLERVLRYLEGTLGIEMAYGSGSESEGTALRGFVTADLAGDLAKGSSVRMLAITDLGNAVL